MSNQINTRRIQLLKRRLSEIAPSADIENVIIATNACMETAEKPYYYQAAYAIHKILTEKFIPIWEDELIVGSSGRKQRGAVVCFGDCTTNTDGHSMIDDICASFTMEESERNVLLEYVKPYWAEQSIARKHDEQISQEIDALPSYGLQLLWHDGHWELSIDYSLVIKEGLEGIEARINHTLAGSDAAVPDDRQKSEYLKSLLLICSGLRQLGQRYSRKASIMAKVESNPLRKRELFKIADVCDHVPGKPPRDFYEALQSMLFLHICVNIVREYPVYRSDLFAHALYPLYIADLKAGRITTGEAQELLDCLWLKFSESFPLHERNGVPYFSGRGLARDLSAGDNASMDESSLLFMLTHAAMVVQSSSTAF